MQNASTALLGICGVALRVVSAMILKKEISMTTERQKIARARNFCVFSLKGVRAQMLNLTRYNDMGCVTDEELATAQKIVTQIEELIDGWREETLRQTKRR
jgi:hypothetical protein